MNKINSLKSVEELRNYVNSQINNNNKDVEIITKRSDRSVADRIIESKKTRFSNSKNLIKNDDGVEVGNHKIYGKYIAIDGVIISVDCWNPEADLVYVSHAHMDHIPILPRNFTEKLKKKNNYPKFLCSALTRDISELRTRGRFTIPDKIWLLGREMKWNEKISTTFKGIKITLLP
ncbi:MAG: hypothetical protein GF383_15755, partial [Candidatus Lokiarchaeota archaeon]|nr:hypothetical protein [Candidatus Lokiarchaeota archaeon]MBD3343082.1 hypothetical protein [Candidatus Lokiarchaeota archaeon]